MKKMLKILLMCLIALPASVIGVNTAPVTTREKRRKGNTETVFATVSSNSKITTHTIHFPTCKLKGTSVDSLIQDRLRNRLFFEKLTDGGVITTA